MSKRSTTGLPDKNRATSQQPERQLSRLEKVWEQLLGNPKNRAEREEGFVRLIIRTVGVLALVLAVLFGISLLNEQVIVPNQAIASVRGEAITVQQFRDRLRFEQITIANRLNNDAAQLQAFGINPNQYFSQNEPYRTLLNEINFPDQLGRRVLDDMIGELLAEQEARQLGVTVTQDDVQEQINQFFGFDPTRVAMTGMEPTATTEPTVTPTPFVSPTPSPTFTPTPLPTMTPTPDPEATAEVSPTIDLPTITPMPTLSIEDQQRQFEENVRNYNLSIRQATGIGQDVIDQSFRRQALRDAVADYLLGEEKRTTYVRLRHILVATREQAQDVIAALNNGESFSALAAAVSTDPGSAQNGGVYDWSPALNYVDAFRDAALTLEIGAISEPVQTEFGFHVIQVMGREERVVAEADLDRVKQALFNQWLKELRLNNQPNISIASNWVDFVPPLQ
ncbi:peptidylprolyl isomerase [Aggregatilineales bacterium SYSU G02658]